MIRHVMPENRCFSNKGIIYKVVKWCLGILLEKIRLCYNNDKAVGALRRGR
jgi:hypothetical protein